MRWANDRDVFKGPGRRRANDPEIADYAVLTLPVED